MKDKPKRYTSIHVYPDFSGGKIFFDLIGRRKMLRAMFNIVEQNCECIDRHMKASIFDKYAGACDVFKKCNLSIIEYNRYILKDIGIEGIFKKLEELWEQDK